MPKTIAHITDIHLDEDFPREQGVDQKANWSIILKDLIHHQVDQVVFGGDIGLASAHPYFFGSLKGYPLKLSLGNHDRFEEIRHSTNVDESRSGLYDYSEDGNFRYIFLDSSTERVSDKQFQWLSGAVQCTIPVILFVHHPVLEVPSFVDSGYALQGRERIRDLLFETGNDITILSGHYHFEDDRTEKNIRQMVTPAASYQLAKSDKLIVDNSQFGYRLLHISPQKIETNVIMLKHA